jgi:hypothetical protein
VLLVSFGASWRVAHALLGLAAHVGRISLKKQGACENAKRGGLPFAASFLQRVGSWVMPKNPRRATVGRIMQ